MSLFGVFVVHDALVGGQDDVSKLSGRKNLGEELLEVLDLEVEPGGDHTDLVESANEIDDDLSVSLIVNDFKVGNVSVFLHSM